MYYICDINEPLDRSIESKIASIVKAILESYSMTLDDVVRIVVRELAVAATHAVIDKITEWYNYYKKRG